MKKIIAISVMFALVAGAVFADTSIGGSLSLGTTLLSSGKDAKGDSVVNSGSQNIASAITNVNWSGENAGGMMRLFSGPNATPTWYDIFAFAWWRPIKQFKFQIGQNPDGNFGHGEIQGWGYNAEAQDLVATDQYNDVPVNSKVAIGGNAGYYGGFSGFGLYLSIFPVDGCEINFGIPMKQVTEAATEFSNTTMSFSYNIDGIGTILLGTALKKGTQVGDNFVYDPDADLLTDIHFAFYLKAIDNIGFEIGGGYIAESKDYSVIKAGIGFRFNADDLTLKARVGFVNGDKDKGGSKKVGVGVLPIVNLGSLIFYFNAGFGMDLDVEEATESVGKMDWFVNPYIKVPANSGNFYAGLKLISDGKKDADVKWSIPIGWQVYF